MNLIFTSILPIGCTFLDWSFHWLAGGNKYYSDNKKEWTELVLNPLRESDAHQHEKNHPCDVAEWTTMSSNFDSVKSNIPLTYYGYSQSIDGLKKCINDILGFNNRIVLFYSNFYRPRNIPGYRASIKGDYEYFYPIDTRNLYFKETILGRGSGKKSTLAEVRRIIFLNMKNLFWGPDLFPWSGNDFLKSNNLYLIEHNQFIKNGMETMQDLFQKINLKIDDTRVPAWIKIHKEWTCTMQSVLFYNNIMSLICDRITESIIKKQFFQPVSMDVFCEAWLQYQLLEKYQFYITEEGENLESFPKDFSNLVRLFLKK